MSAEPDPETVPADAEQDAGGESESHEDTESRPDVTDEETADLSAVADQIHDEATEDDETGAETPDEETGESPDTDSGGDSGDEGGGSGGSSSREWGDMYVTGLTHGLNAIIDRHGKPDAEPISEDMARDVHLDEAFTEWMEEQDRAEMEPGQEVAFGTAMLAATVLLTRTDLPNQVLAEVEI